MSTLLKEIRLNVHGVISILLAGIAVIIGFATILVDNLNFAALYLLVLFASPLAICYFYCLKCPCRIKNCGHVFPGKLTRIFKPRSSSKYTFWDMFAMVFSFLLIIGIPQIWLIKTPFLLVIFWLFMTVAAAEALIFVCKRCNNRLCPLNQLKKTV